MRGPLLATALLLTCLLAVHIVAASAGDQTRGLPKGEVVRFDVPPAAECGTATAELLLWGMETNLLTADQHLHLLTECQRRVATDQQRPGLVGQALAAVNSRLTLINVLYFFGALLVICAMTLFMTLGWESFGGWGIFTIATMYGLIFALMGRFFWNPAGDEGWNTLGGLLFTMSISMTPLAVYGVERATGIWPGVNGGSYTDYYRYVKSSWLPMEVATCVVGSVVLYFVRFPFLTMPVAITLWLMSMDLTAVLYSKSSWSQEQRAKVSMYFGAAVLGGAYYVDRWLGCSQDFAFWFYLAGVVSFWLGLTLQGSSHEVGGVVYLAINMLMMVYAQIADRFIFTLFGFTGILLLTYVSIDKMTIKYATFVYMRGVLAVILLLAAHKFNASAPYWASLVVIGLYNTQVTIKGTSEFEGIHILRLLFNLGLYEGSSAFAGHKASLLFFAIDAQLPLALVAGVSMLAFHVPAIVNQHRFFLGYRLILCHAMMLGSVYCPSLLYLGALGIALYVASKHRIHQASFRQFMLNYFLGVSLVVFSEIFDSRIVFYVGLAVCLPSAFGCFDHHWRQNAYNGGLFCAFSVAVVLVSVLFQSQFLIILGGGCVFSYLSYLAYNVFRNSLLFPFALTGMGMGVLFVGIQYQKHQDGLHHALLSLLPASLDPSLLTLANVNYGLPAWAQRVVWLPGLVELVGALPEYALPLAIAAVAALALVFLALELFLFPPMDTSATLPIGSCEVIWPQNTSGHGLTFRVDGFKAEEFTLSQAYLQLSGDHVWTFFERNVGQLAVNAFRYGFHPLKLCPSYMDPQAFQQGKDDFSVDINLGTGHNGTQRVSHATLLRHLNVLNNSGSSSFSLQVVQRSGLFWRNRRLLFEIPIQGPQLLISAYHSANHRATL